jgi:hypothetical protein
VHQEEGGPSTRTVLLGTLTAAAILLWLLNHINTPQLGVFAFVYAAVVIAIGWTSPLLGGALAILLVPYRGAADPLSFGVSEFLRGAPIWGAVARLVWDRFWRARQPVAAPRDGDEDEDPIEAPNPPLIMLGAALLGAFIAPLQRLVATSMGTFPATNQSLDMFGIFGTQSLFFGAWIFGAHLSSSRVRRLMPWFAVSLALALAIALMAWVKVPLIKYIAFKANVAGRLAALGYPTPTAMGIAIALPLAFSAIWRTRRVALALITLGVFVAVIFTESRGPLLALFAGGVTLAISMGGVRPQWIALGGVGAALLGGLLVLNRYGRQLDLLLSGQIPNLASDLQRITSWYAGVQTALLHPLTGGGWFSLRYWNDGELGKENVNLSHNIILQGLSDGGFPLGIPFAIIVLGSIVLMLRYWRSIPAGWRAAAVVLIVCGLWDMPQLRAYGSLFGGIALGLVSRRAYASHTETASESLE